MTIGFVSRFFGLLACSALLLSACDDGGSSKSKTDAGMDAGDDEEDASEAEDTSPPRDSGRDASDGATRADTAPPEDPYTCEPPAGPDGGLDEGEACCGNLGTCIVLTSDAGVALGVGDCNAAENLRCLPAQVTGDGGAGDGGAGADGGAGGLVTCRMKLANAADADPDYEGRCVPECLTRGTSSSLSQGECADDFVCVPCYNLITGASTGACNNNGDHPVDTAPTGFAECGEALGYCIPASSAGQTGGNLMQLTCEEGERCAPKGKVIAPDSCFAHCDSPFGPGACIPAFVVPEASRGFLQPASCMTGELCSPCLNPTTMMSTGACN